MASQPEAGAVAGGQPGDRPPGPGQLRQRAGDQQLPVPNDGPSMHDLVIADLADRGLPRSEATAICDLLLKRKQIGLERYGSLLQAGNGRDWRRDMLEELADAAVYARQGLEESGLDADLGEVYHYILSALFWAQRIPVVTVADLQEEIEAALMAITGTGEEAAFARQLAAQAKAADDGYKVAAVRAAVYTFLHQYGRSELPTFKVAIDLAVSLRKIIDGLGSEEEVDHGR